MEITPYTKDHKKYQSVTIIYKYNATSIDSNIIKNIESSKDIYAI